MAGAEAGADPAESERAARRLTVVVDASVYGGAERHVVSVLERLPARFQPTVLAVEPVAPALTAELRRLSVPCRTARAVGGKFDVAGLAALTRRLAATRPSLVHVNMATAANNRHAVMAARLLRRRTVVSVHSLAAMESGLQRRLLHLSLAGARAAMTPSRAIADQLIELMGVPKDRVVVVRNGVPASPARTDRPTNGVVRIACVGRLSPEKGQGVLIDACRLLVDEGRLIELVLVGDGPDRAELERRAAGLPCRFTGDVEDPHRILAEADVYCQPSRTEGLPLALLEAMMTGLPCVATAVGDVPDLQPEVIVVPPDDATDLAVALGALSADPERRRALGATARSRVVAEYSVDGTVDAVVQVYRAALA